MFVCLSVEQLKRLTHVINVCSAHCNNRCSPDPAANQEEGHGVGASEEGQQPGAPQRHLREVIGFGTINSVVSINLVDYWKGKHSEILFSIAG